VVAPKIAPGEEDVFIRLMLDPSVIITPTPNFPINPARVSLYLVRDAFFGPDEV